MSKSLGGWIHTFAVTETNTHKKGYTVYKITSIVFPRAVPEALTCVTVWKRFHDVKRLYREILKRHKALQLRGQVPELKDSSFFKRFDPDVILARKQYILKLLDFAAQHPALYKSHPFLNFFENGHTPNTSPAHKGNIENICDNLDLNVDDNITLIDPRKDNELTKPKQPNVTTICSDKKEDINSSKEIPETKDEEDKEEDDAYKILTPQLSFEGDDDYIYEAAYEFSKAVQAEVNQEYQEAYERYKSGVDKLLTGSKDDTNDERKFIAKAKVTKYMARADDLYEKQLLNKREKMKSLQLSIDSTDSSTDICLERPWNQLSKFKVMRIIDNVMQVQDVTDKSVYIMKAIEKPPSNSNAHSIFLPQGVPYMVGLVGFFQSDTAIYLLLHQAKGGKLFDYIRTYTPTNLTVRKLDDIFLAVDKSEVKVRDEKTNSDSNVAPSSKFDSGFVEIVKDCKNGLDRESSSKIVNDKNGAAKVKDVVELQSTSNANDDIPSFNLLSQDMDVSDLVHCSQKLLRSVSSTLEDVKDTKKAILAEEKPNENISTPSKTKEQSNCGNEVNLEKKIALPEASVKQWARELITAIESLHMKGVILGDLNPKNLLLGSKGQLLLSYFYQNEGHSSNLQLLIDATAVEGGYVAPERPLTIKSDWWSFGVILFELLTGYAFKSCHPGGQTSYYDIQYPDVDISHLATDLLNSVLEISPERRFGEEKIKSHSFFEGTNWSEIASTGVNFF